MLIGLYINRPKQIYADPVIVIPLKVSSVTGASELSQTKLKPVSTIIIKKPVQTAKYSPPRVSGLGSLNLYQPGQCTWGVKEWKPSIPNGWGNANQWLSSARRAGWRISSSPVAGAVGVTGNHVVYVLSVGATTVTIKEMNYNYIPYSVRIKSTPKAAYLYIY